MEANQQIRDGALLVVLYIVMMFFAMLIPSSFFIIVFLMPIPFIIFARRYDLQQFLIMIGATALAVFLLTVLTGNLLITPIFVLTLAGGLAIGTALHKKKSAYETWMQGTIGFVIGLLFVFLYTQFVLGINWAEEIDLAIGQSIQNLSVMAEQFSQLVSSESINDSIEMLEAQMSIMQDLIPVGIALLAIFMAFLTQWFAYRIIGRLENRPLRFPPVRQLQFPVAVVWIYIIGIIITLFENNPSSGLFIGAQNVMMLTGFLMILQGFSFLFFYAHHKNRSNILPMIAVVLSIMIPILWYLIRLVGLIDLAFSLRDQMQKKQGR